MRTKTLAILFSAFALAACGDNGPDPIQLTEAQAEDMMDALASAGAFDPGTGLGVVAQMRSAAIAEAVVTSTVQASGPCPDGGTAGINGSVTINDNNAPTVTFTMSVAQTFSGCMSTSTEGNLWTFNGAPNITSTFSMSMNESTGAFTMTGTQKGALDVAGPDGSGRCVIDISLSLTGNDNTGALTGSLTGTVCGVSIETTIDASA
jgi:hypothetical protein